MADKSALQQWWDQLPSYYQQSLKTAAVEQRLDDPGLIRVLADLECPAFSEDGAGSSGLDYGEPLPQFVKQFMIDEA